MLPTVGSPEAPQSLRGIGLWLSLLFCLLENKQFSPRASYSPTPRAEGCPKKAQQDPDLGPGSQAMSKGTHDPPALAEETTGCL